MPIKKIIIFLTVSIAIISSNANATECFERVSRSVFKFNMMFDDIILEPVAKGYNKLPKPIKTGTNNFTSNISTLLQYLILYYKVI